jgi:hypothetical protein
MPVSVGTQPPFRTPGKAVSVHTGLRENIVLVPFELILQHVLGVERLPGELFDFQSVRKTVGASRVR